ncbi:anti-sigma-I factor RsgI family protein [Acetivibrio clariflavus]|uniref:Cellulose binding domain-containing protein n=1 Tax=Acetivibrio clariflavus (strain DSM 19732 / NBRC 101661 / EBR45) TaxID=720554 RepID=G8LSP0_ACECE|nr:anti-sigma factor domain-containing protein [Acetivibrio clariflavus]AEV69392.1 Cellulose binding domain-containing protein [Acetivibrio clariflavus DSM 19732]
MMKLGIVYEIHKNKAVVLTPDCEFLVIKRRRDMYLGQQVKFNIKDVRKNVRPMNRYASIAASIAAVFLLTFLHFKVLFYGEIYGYIDVDINPSIEFVVDRDFEVLKAKALNNDAKKIAKELDAKGKDAYSVINDFLDKCEKYGYIVPKKNNVVLVSASVDGSVTKDSEENEELDKFLLNIDKKLSIENKENITSMVIKVSPEDRKEALKYNISMGKYYLMEKAKEKGMNLSAGDLNEEKVSELLAALDAKDDKEDVMAKEASADLKNEDKVEDKKVDSNEGKAEDKGKDSNQNVEQKKPVTSSAAQTIPEPTREPDIIPAINPATEPKTEPTQNPVEKPDELPANDQKVVATPKVKPDNTVKPTEKSKSVEAVDEGSLKIKMLSKHKNTKVEIISTDFQIINTSGKDIDLRNVKVRYYFTREGRADLEPAVYHYSIRSTRDESRCTQFSNSEVKISFHKVSGSDMYMEITFTRGVLKKDEYAYVMTAFNNAKWDRMDQSDDYSFIPDAYDFKVTQKVTGYISDKLVWGKEPY